MSKATVDDVDEAVEAAKEAFEGTWRDMNPRDRGTLMFKYDLGPYPIIKQRNKPQ